MPLRQHFVLPNCPTSTCRLGLARLFQNYATSPAGHSPVCLWQLKIPRFPLVAQLFPSFVPPSSLATGYSQLGSARLETNPLKAGSMRLNQAGETQMSSRRSAAVCESLLEASFLGTVVISFSFLPLLRISGATVSVFASSFCMLLRTLGACNKESSNLQFSDSIPHSFNE